MQNAFARVMVSSIDGKPIAQAGRLLVTAGSRVTNTNLKWNEQHTRTANQGESPTLIEPVTGTLRLRGLQGATAVSSTALDGSGHAIGEAVAATKSGDDWSIPMGTPVTTWYSISVKRR